MISLSWAFYDIMPESSILCCSGGSRNLFPLLPPNADYVKLPSYHAYEKEWGLELFPARLQLHMPQLHAIREEILAAVALAYRPNVLISDYLPLGKNGELEKAIRLTRSMPDRLICLGLREIMDDSSRIRKTLKRHVYGSVQTYFDVVFIYGDEQVFDTIKEYDIPEDIRNICLNVGYLVNKNKSWAKPDKIRADLGCKDSDRLVIANFGGGKNAEDLVFNVLLAWQEIVSIQPTKNLRLVIVLGPYANAKNCTDILALASKLGSVTVLDVVPWLVEFINAADLFVGTSSYNIGAELLATGTPAVLMPRQQVDSDEQTIRAKTFERFGYAAVKTPYAPSEIAQAILCMYMKKKGDSNMFSTDGATRVAKYVKKWSMNIPDASLY
jgi:predicted glycosyltransferase